MNPIAHLVVRPDGFAAGVGGLMGPPISQIPAYGHPCDPAAMTGTVSLVRGIVLRRPVRHLTSPIHFPNVRSPLTVNGHAPKQVGMDTSDNGNLEPPSIYSSRIKFIH